MPVMEYLSTELVADFVPVVLREPGGHHGQSDRKGNSQQPTGVENTSMGSFAHELLPMKRNSIDVEVVSPLVIGRERRLDREMERDPRIDAIAPSDLSSAAILTALIGALGAKGDEEVREVYEQALYLLEGHEGDEPEVRPIYEAAREIIEAQLRPE